MNNHNHISKKTIYGLCGILVLWALGAQAQTLPPEPDNAALLYFQAFLLRPKPDSVAEKLVYNTPQENIYKVLRGGKLEPDPEVEVPEIKGAIHKLEEQIYEIEEQIKNRGADPNKMIPGTEQPLSEHPLFVQQLFDEMRSLEKLRKSYEKMLYVDSNKKIRNYLRKCRQMIEVAQAASKISKCNWGYLYLQESGSFSHQLMIEARYLEFILRADALLLAADGDYRAAFESCLMMRQFARHLADESSGVFYSVPISVEAFALSCMQLVLGTMSPDEEILKWLSDQFAGGLVVSEALSMRVKQDFERDFREICKQPRYISWLRQKFAEEAANDKLKKEALSLTDEELISLIREPYAEFIDSILKVLASNMPYEQTYARIERLTKELIEQVPDNPAFEPLAKSMPHRYGLQFAHTTYINALKVAIEIYLTKAKTGELPKKLPSGLPKDPYSSQDFGYEITQEGFAFHCKGKRFNEGRLKRKLEFKVHK